SANCLGGRDVVASGEERNIGQLEALCNLIPGGKQSKPTAHGACPHHLFTGLPPASSAFLEGRFMKMRLTRLWKTPNVSDCSESTERPGSASDSACAAKSAVRWLSRERQMRRSRGPWAIKIVAGAP